MNNDAIEAVSWTQTCGRSAVVDSGL